MTTRRHLLLAACALPMGLSHPAKACDFFSSRLRIWHPWTRATRVDADTAKVCMRFDEVRQTDRLIGIETPVAGGGRLAGPDIPPDRAGLSLLIRQGEELTLTEDGVHIELLDLQHPLQVGRTFALRLIFEHAGAVETALNVDYAGPR